MTRLEFPTMAERCVAEFRAKTQTIAFPTIARRYDAEVTKLWRGIEYRFDDDTSVIVTGTGASHRMETFLP